MAFRAEREVFYGADWFEQIVIDVPQGEHIYEFTATTDEDTGSPFQLDPFFCDNP